MESRDLAGMRRALEEAEKAGVKVIFLPCHVEPDQLAFARTGKLF